jgi:hypothetical protein
MGWSGAIPEGNIHLRCRMAPLQQIRRSEPLASTAPLRGNQSLPRISPASEAVAAALNQAGLERRRPGLASTPVDLLVPSTAAPMPFLYFPTNSLLHHSPCVHHAGGMYPCDSVCRNCSSAPAPTLADDSTPSSTTPRHYRWFIIHPSVLPFQVQTPLSLYPSSIWCEATAAGSIPVKLQPFLELLVFITRKANSFLSPLVQFPLFVDCVHRSGVLIQSNSGNKSASTTQAAFHMCLPLEAVFHMCLLILCSSNLQRCKHFDIGGDKKCKHFDTIHPMSMLLGA